MNAADNSRTAIITGGATGIGYAVAEQFTQQGASVLLIGRTEQKLENGAGKLQHPGRTATLAADITRPDCKYSR